MSMNHEVFLAIIQHCQAAFVISESVLCHYECNGVPFGTYVSDRLSIYGPYLLIDAKGDERKIINTFGPS